MGTTPYWYEVAAFVAMVFCGLALGLLAGCKIGWEAHKREVAELWPGADRVKGLSDLPAPGTVANITRDPGAPVLSDAMTIDLLERLVDASLPKPVYDPKITQRSAAEYEEPLPDSEDWTDSIPGFEPPRSDVAGLRPGEAIPGLPPIVEQWRQMGEAAFDEIEATGAATVAGSWVEPIRLSDDELVD